MMRKRQFGCVGVLLTVLFLAGPVLVEAVDRDKLLTEPGVYGAFAVFKVDEDWWTLDKAARLSARDEIQALFQKHAEKLAVETYVVRGLSERADFFLRVHATRMVETQEFLIDFMGTALGKHVKNTDTLNGLTKKA
ncbi:MAG: chlorite dismutase family protein, partial [Nitrospiraceae bacterium]